MAKDVKTAPEKLQEYKDAFQNAIDDDINVPMALGVLWTMVKQPYSRDIYELALDFDKVFGLSLDKAKPEEKPEIEVPDDIRAIADERFEARKSQKLGGVGQTARPALGKGLQRSRFQRRLQAGKEIIS